MSAKNSGRCLSYQCNICYTPMGSSAIVRVSMAIIDKLKGIKCPFQVLEVHPNERCATLRFPFYESARSCIVSWSHLIMTPCGHMFHKACLMVNLLTAWRGENPEECPACNTRLVPGTLIDLDIPVHCNTNTPEKTATVEDNSLTLTAYPNSMKPACDKEICNRRAELQATTHDRMDKTVTETFYLAKILDDLQFNMQLQRQKFAQGQEEFNRRLAVYYQVKAEAAIKTRVRDTRILTPASPQGGTTTSTATQGGSGQTRSQDSAETN
ncbi:hypothetical protein Ocin01_11650 [Orchesella cincta]|uniref:RING-type domain-containing protein n=1 Tax=Orchesella cincta TaxID=48709 RepID=A0A1D2MPQ0_ORCCI|nr:hypothetical protein Ocin01_11650 [Orchesella cincta]